MGSRGRLQIKPMNTTKILIRTLNDRTLDQKKNPAGPIERER